MLPKGSKARDVPLSGRAAVVLSEHIAAHPPVTVRLPFGKADGKLVAARLLFTAGGKPVRHQHLNDAVRKPALRGAGMATTGPDDKVSMHALRHFAASSWLAGGASIKDVAEYLGHASAAFTLRVYAHLMPSAADKVRAAMDASLAESAPDVQRLRSVSEN